MDAQHAEKDQRAKLARKHEEAAPDADTQTPNPVMDLQRMVGNREVQRMLAQRQAAPAPTGIQTKLTVGAPDDVYEQEADSVAHQVMTMPADVQRQAPEEEELAMKRIQRQAPEEEELAMKRIQRQAPEEEELAMKRIQREDIDEEELAMKRIQRSSDAAVPDVTDETEGQIESMRGGGQAMPDNARGFFESRFEQDFSSVNVHTGAEADSLNRQLDARAFTTGSDIFFRSGEYNPESSGGRELLAHELTHVVQQGGSQAQRKEDCDDCG